MLTSGNTKPTAPPQVLDSGFSAERAENGLTIVPALQLEER